MTLEQKIKNEMSRLAAADELVNAALSLYGAVKATEIKQPRLVVASLPALERAIERWASLEDYEPQSEAENSP